MPKNRADDTCNIAIVLLGTVKAMQGCYPAAGAAPFDARHYRIRNVINRARRRSLRAIRSLPPRFSGYDLRGAGR